MTVRLVHKGMTESERLLKLARFGKDGAVGTDAYDGAENLWRHCVRRVAVNHGTEPLSICAMIRGVGPEGIHKHIHVRQNHRRPSILSRRAPDLSRSTPGAKPPPSRETGSVTRLRRSGDCDSANTSRNPCSMREVMVSPLWCAARLTCWSRCSFRRTVVLIFQSYQRYVNMSRKARAPRC